MFVPFFDGRRLYVEQQQQLDEATRSVLATGNYLFGPNLQRFEQALKQTLTNNSFGAVIGCHSGTDALILSLRAAALPAGARVLCPSHTAIPTVSAVVAANAVPVFVDIDPHTWLMDLHHLDQLLDDSIQAIIAVHLYGNMVAVQRLADLLKRRGRTDVVVIEDAAQAMGSHLDGLQAGTQGHFGAYSFYPTKNLGAMGDAGAVFAREEHDARRVQALAFYGQQERHTASLPHGINSRLDELQAAILAVRLPMLATWSARKADMMQTYRCELAHLPVQFQSVTPGCNPAWHLAVIAVADRAARDRLRDYLTAQQVQTLIHYPVPTHIQPAFKTFATAGLPVTEQLCQRIVSLPLYPGLTEAEQQWVIGGIKSAVAD